MTIYELADMTGTILVIKRYAPSGRYEAFFEMAETKDNELSNTLGGSPGEGNSLEDAILDYIKKIRGKWIVVNATNEKKRNEFGVPINLVMK